MSFTSERAGRAQAPELLAALAAWTPATWSGQLHPADIGWQLRFEDDVLDGTLQLVRDASSAAVVAVGLLDDPTTLRLAVDPARTNDSGLAVFLADLAEDVVADGEAYVDGALLAVWRGVLATRGWDTDPDAWVALHRDLTGVATELPAGVAPVGRSEVADRVAVQRAAFERTSTFTAERWALMAASPAYDASLDLLVRDEAGTPVATGTAWSAGPGRCGMLEPVGTSAEHRGRGHATRLLHSLCAALAAAGASSAAVATPAANTVAVQAYNRAGFLTLGLTTAMRRPG